MFRNSEVVATTLFFSERFKLEQPVYVTRPWMPAFDDYVARLRPLWETRWLTNHGEYAREFESRLRRFGRVAHCAVVSSGTQALVCALEALGVRGDVLVTPLTFVATTHALHWTGCRPVFCDVEHWGWNIDPVQVEAAITPQTTAILAVHLYGHPCKVDVLQKIARKHELALIYDAAHTAGCRYDGRPLVSYGDASILSFHATKPLTTIEGGAVFTNLPEVDDKVRLLRDFGFDETNHVVLPGFNAKMNEFEAAMGLLQLDGLDSEIARRKRVYEQYRAGLESLPGIFLPVPVEGCEYNHCFMPIRIDKELFGATLGELDEVLQAHNIFGRQYFRPLNNDLPWFRESTCSHEDRLPNARQALQETFCLPIYGDLEPATLDAIIEIIRSVHGAGRRA